MLRTLAVTGLACGIATAALLAQGPPTFRADTHLVEVSVIVHGKAGEPVTGLTRDDFTLLEDGKEQPIEMFSVDGSVLVRNGATAAAPVAAEPTPPLARGDISNRLEAGVRAGTVTAILFDRVNTRIEDQHPARQQIANFLGQIRPDDRVALYSLEWSRLRVLHDFTNDATSLLRALSWPAAADRPPDDPDLAAWISRTSEVMSAVMAQNRANLTLDALVGVAQHLAGVRGRKNLIWVSSGIPWAIKDENVPIPVGRAARAVDDANVAIYPIDARGLVANTGVAPAETMPEVAAMKGKVTSKPIIPERGVAQTVPNFEAMKALASGTGGRAFINSNDIKTAIRSAIDDGRMTYVLGYYPSHGKWDGAFRQITVKVKRPGVEVRHRNGYRAYPMSAKAPAQPANDLIAEAKSPLAATGLGLTVHISPAETAGVANRDVTLTVHVDPDGMSIWRDGDGWSVSLALAIAQSAADGHVVKSVLGNVDVGVPASRYEQIMTRGFSFTRTVTLADTADQMHVVLRDPSSGATGSLIIPIAPPASPR
jgi:VWFA-related protein